VLSCVADCCEVERYVLTTIKRIIIIISSSSSKKDKILIESLYETTGYGSASDSFYDFDAI